MENITLRLTCPEDAAFLCELMNVPAVREVLHEPSTPLSLWEEAIPVWDADPDEEDYIILSDGRPAGWLGVNGLLEKSVFIKMLVLLPGYQDKGIGTAALKEMLNLLGRRGYTSAALYTDACNLRAQRCYEKCGFCTTEHLTEKMSDGSIADRIRMEVCL